MMSKSGLEMPTVLTCIESGINPKNKTRFVPSAEELPTAANPPTEKTATLMCLQHQLSGVWWGYFGQGFYYNRTNLIYLH